MRYKEIKIELADWPDRLNRTICVKEDTSLIELGVIIGVSMNADFSHFFLFRSGKNSYEPLSWTEESHNKNELPMKDYCVKDLGNEFTFIYDTGEDWCFDCKSEDIEYDNMRKKKCVVFEATGAGIFEDDHFTFDRYIEGIVSPEMNEDDEEAGIYMPHNLELECFGDFDKPVDLKEMNRYINDDVELMMDCVAEEYIYDKDYGFEGFGNIKDEAFIECRDRLAYCYERLGELIEGIGDLNESLTNKYGKDKAKEVMKAVVMNHLIDLLDGEEE